MPDANERIERALLRFGIRLEPAKVQELATYFALLARWNTRMNLTAFDEGDAALERLIIEPVIAAGSIDADARTLVDVGSGGGSPAGPLKVVRPDVSLTMVEVKSRKAVFLREVVRHLGWQDARVENDRFEEVLKRAGRHRSFDVLSMRAVRAGEQELRLFANALKPGGQLLWFLSSAQEVADLPAALHVEREVPLVSSLSSRLLVIRKTK